MQQGSSVEIDRPIEEVFDYALNNVAEWSITVVEDEVLEEKSGGGVGTTFRTVTEEKGRRMEFQGVVKQYERPTLHAITLTGQHFDIDIEYRFEDLGGRTRLTQQSEVTGKGFVKVMFVLFGWLINKSGCKAVENELMSLKRHAEGRTAQPVG
jgi:hypothetical protein